MGPRAYRQLCDVAAAHGLHVELWTDHRASSARGPREPTPQIDQLIITDAKHKAVHRAPVGLRNLDQASEQALAEIAR